MDSLITISKDSTLVKGIIGGVLIAGASSALLYLTGNITGISGTYIIIFIVFQKGRQQRCWRKH